MNRSILLAVFFTLVFNRGIHPQETPTQKEIDKTIEKGVAYLEQQLSAGAVKDPRIKVFIAYALAHCGIRPDDPLLKPIVQEILTQPPTDTYHASIYIMALATFDRDNDTYRERMAECAQILVGSQTPDGQWDYPLGSKAEREKKLATGKSRQNTIHIKSPARYYENPDTKRRWANNSNTQFVLLALHAAAKAGIHAPNKTWELSSQYWEKYQNPDGGWGYLGRRAGTGENSKDLYSPYSISGTPPNDKRDYVSSYGSMTCAGLAGLAICMVHLGKDYKNNASFKKGLEWLRDKFSVDQVPGKMLQEFVESKHNPLYYYLYSLERTGTIAGTDAVGTHDWYKEGAAYLIKEQNPGGSWKPEHERDERFSSVTSTVYALLFLKRASTGLIDTGGKTHEKFIDNDPQREKK